MHIVGQDDLKLRNKDFFGERLVLESCQGYIEGCSFLGSATTLIGRVPATARKSMYTQIDGGAILVTGSSRVVFRHCKFAHNVSAMCGGAVSLQAETGSVITFERCVFEDNTAADTGPAIDVLTTGMKVIIRKCAFRKNHSTRKLTSVDLGQISIFPGNVVDITESTFVGAEIDIDSRGEVEFGTDKKYRIRNVTNVRNNRLPYKAIANCLAYLAHLRYHPWI